MTRLAPLLILPLLGLAWPDDPAASPWLTDYDTARAEAQRTGKPIFAVFT